MADNDVLLGDAQTGARAIKEARDLWRRASKSEAVETVVRDADFALNPERNIRTRLARWRRRAA